MEKHVGSNSSLSETDRIVVDIKVQNGNFTSEKLLDFFLFTLCTAV